MEIPNERMHRKGRKRWSLAIPKTLYVQRPDTEERDHTPVVIPDERIKSRVDGEHVASLPGQMEFLL